MWHGAVARFFGGGGDDGVDSQFLNAASDAMNGATYEAGRAWLRAFGEFDARNGRERRNIERDLDQLCKGLCEWFRGQQDTADTKFLFVLDAMFRVAKYLAYLPANSRRKAVDWQRPVKFKDLMNLIGQHLTNVWSSRDEVDKLCHCLRTADAEVRRSLLGSVTEFFNIWGNLPWRTALENWVLGRAVFSFSAVAPLILHTAVSRNPASVLDAIAGVSAATFSSARVADRPGAVVRGAGCAAGEWTPSAQEFVRRFRILIEVCFPDLPSQDDAKRAVTKDIMSLLKRELVALRVPERVRAAVLCGSQVIASFGAAPVTGDLRALLDEWLIPNEATVAALVESVMEVCSLEGYACRWPRSYVQTLADGRLQSELSGRLLLLLISECTKRERAACPYSRERFLQDLDASLYDCVSAADGRRAPDVGVLLRMMAPLPFPTDTTLTTSWCGALPRFYAVLKEKCPSVLAEYAVNRMVADTEQLVELRGIVNGVANSLRAALGLQFGREAWAAWPVSAWVQLVSKIKLRNRDRDTSTEVVRGALLACCLHAFADDRHPDFELLSQTLFVGVDMRSLMEDRGNELTNGERRAYEMHLAKLPWLYVSLCDALAARYLSELRGHTDALTGLAAACDAMRVVWGGGRELNELPAPRTALQVAFAAQAFAAVSVSVRSSRCALRGSFAVAFAADRGWSRPDDRLAHDAAFELAMIEAQNIVTDVEAVLVSFGSDAVDVFVVKFVRVDTFAVHFARIAAVAGDVLVSCDSDGFRVQSCVRPSEQKYFARGDCVVYRCGNPVSFRVAARDVVGFLDERRAALPLSLCWITYPSDVLRLAVEDARAYPRIQQQDVIMRKLASAAVAQVSDFSSVELEQLNAAPKEVAAVLRPLDSTVTEAIVRARVRQHQSSTRHLEEELNVLRAVDDWLRNVLRQCGQALREDSRIEWQTGFATGTQLAAAKLLFSQRIMLGSHVFTFSAADVDREATLHCMCHFIGNNCITFRDQFATFMHPMTQVRAGAAAVGWLVVGSRPFFSIYYAMFCGHDFRV